MSLGEPDSMVIGHVIDGIFDGAIHSKNGTYHIEKAHKFFTGPQNFHSIIYREDGVNAPTFNSKAKDEMIERLNELASQAVPLDDSKMAHQAHSRLKRNNIGNRRFCRMRLAADHLYRDNIGQGSVGNTMSQMAAIVASVQRIFSLTDFSGDNNEDSIQPVIASLEVLDENAPGYRYGGDSIDVVSFLEMWSQENQAEFCLAVLFTYRDFDGGVLGLAYVAQPPGGFLGGICEPRVRIEQGIKSLNTAVVSAKNFGRTVPQPVTVITTAHELGHGFGSRVSFS